MEFLLYKLGCFIVVRLPAGFSYFLAKRCAEIHFWFSPGLRRVVTRNLRVVLLYRAVKEGRPLDKRILRKTVRKAYSNFACHLVDFFRIPLWNSGRIRRQVEIINIRYLDEALRQGKGAVVLTAHLGNWELAGVIASLLGYSLYAVALPFRNQQIARIFVKRRQSKGVKVVLTGSNPKVFLRAFKENKIIAVLGDRLFTEKGIEVTFMGRPTLIPRGPATLAVRSGAKYLPGFLLRKDGGYALVFEDFLEAPDGLSEQEKVRFLVQRGVKVLEDYILKYPDQWLNFSPMWE